MAKGVLLIGPMGVGKTTIAQLLAAKGWLRYSISEPIGRIAKISHPWLEGASKAVRRPYLQKIGRWLRGVTPDPLLYHANVFLDGAQEWPVVIDDGRTDREAQWARSVGLAVVVVTCEEEERKRRLVERDGMLPDQWSFTDSTEKEWELIEAPRVDTTNLSPGEAAELVLMLASLC